MRLEELPEPLQKAVRDAETKVNEIGKHVSPKAALMLRSQWHAHLDPMKPSLQNKASVISPTM